MYTEDDEEVKLKNKKNNRDDSDFYTSFRDPVQNDAKKKTTKPKREEVVEVQDEDDYSDFYGTNDEEPEPSNNKGNIIKIVIIAVLLIVLIALLIILFGTSNKVKGDIELAKENYTLKVGEKEFVSYKIVDTESSVHSTFTSSNPNVVAVDGNGQITAVGAGTAEIIVHYTIDGKTRDKKCKVTVENVPVKHEISLNLTPSTTEWTNQDVTITVDAKTDSSITSLQYGTNCTSDCVYSNVSNGKIVISNSGTTVVTVIAKDANNQQITKTATVKIDKTAPTITFNNNTNISGTKEVNVCATCSDNESGCKQAKVCKKYTSSQSNQTITVYDNAGNSQRSKTFNVTINNVTQPCRLTVTTDGTVKATLNGKFTYYGFSSNYSGSNTLSQKVSISASKKGESGAKIIYYYVKSQNGSKGSCHLTVIKECKCKTNTSNCAVTCTFRAG